MLEEVMSDATIKGCVRAAGIEIDFRRMCLPANLEDRYGSLLDGAVVQMQAIERGDVVNVDERWQVGHYWLRDPERAPPGHGAAIDAALRDIHTFWEKHFHPEPKFRNVLWIGIGGSGLGPQMLYDALRTPGNVPAMFFFDNTDPSGFKRTLQEIELAGGLKSTLTVVVSKSGGTKETRNGMLVAQEKYQDAKLDFANHAVAITKPDSKLDKSAAAWLARFPIWDFVGGRTSLFSAVGMLPAKLLGLDVEALRAGAKAMDAATRGRDSDANPALLLAATWYHTVENLGLRNMVVLPYCDRLVLLSKYLQQLVMESLGKHDKGITVFGNKGSTDQHAYVQQLRDGYRDFFVSFIRVLVPEADWEVEPGVTCGDYLAAFQEGTARALSDAGRLSLRTTLERIDEHSLGALVALFERAVGYYGALLGINAYHQPGVEAGKKAADDVIAVQCKLLSFLKSEPDRDFAVAELAEEVGASPQEVYDILDRLAHTARFGLEKAVPPTAPDEAEYRFGIGS
jgi:glucose-6-phosphate isomerase